MPGVPDDRGSRIAAKLHQWMVFRVRLCAQPSSQVGVILYYLMKCFQISITGTEALAQLPMKESFLRYQPKNPDQQWPPNHIRMVFLNNKVAKLLQNIFHPYFEIKIQCSQYTNWVQIMSWYMNIYQYVKCHWGFQNLPTWTPQFMSVCFLHSASISFSR